MGKLIKFEPYKERRAASAEVKDLGDRRVELSFSSEFEVSRWFGYEVLDHSPESVDLSRMANAPLLFEHNRNKQIGVVEKAWIGDDRRGYAVVRFSKNKKANEIYNDVVDGIRTNISFAYNVISAAISGLRDGEDVWRVSRWQPMEISSVSLPADPTVGVGRSLEEIQQSQQSEQSERKEIQVMGAAVRKEENEDTRVEDILAAGERYGDEELAKKVLRGGGSLQDFQREYMEKIHARAAVPLNQQVAVNNIGMSERELREFSVVKLLRHMVDPTSKKAAKAAAFEIDACRVAAEKYGSEGERTVLPTDFATYRRSFSTRAAMTAANPAIGGKIIAPDFRPESLIERLLSRSVFLGRGRILGGLKGPVTIPKHLTGTDAQWIDEEEEAPETDATFGDITLMQKTLSASTKITRKMIMQDSIGLEDLVQDDLAHSIGHKMDVSVLYGDGVKQPKGLIAQGIEEVTYPSAAPSYPSYDVLVDLETAVAESEALADSMEWIVTSGFRGYGRKTVQRPGEVDSGGPIWEKGDRPGAGGVLGYPATVTTRMQPGHLLFIDFSQLLIGSWGSLEILVNPYAESKKGNTLVTVFHDMDVGIRHTESAKLLKRSA
jgi:HK97 family phage major capsid protein